MNYKNLIKLQRDRRNRLTRVVKRFRLSKMTLLQVEILSQFYQSADTPILEAAVQMLYDCHHFDRMPEASDGEPISPMVFEDVSVGDDHLDSELMP
ncbi:hypothetical protein DOK_08599 [gamma proteobacterium BDW918]|nr:hypothetical protein DOK_08599 [gamma proteobacterium BDW918]